MKDYVTFALLGIGSGAVVSALGLGVVLGFRGSGIVNFALGAVATYVAYVFNALRTQGDYVAPIGKIDMGTSMSVFPALVLALLTAVVLGLLMHVLVFRPLRYAPILAKVVSSIGVALVLQAVVVLRFGSDAQFVPPVLPDDGHSVKIFGVFIPDNRFYLAAIVIVTAIALTALFRYTRIGLSMRAAAESEKGATLLGYSADFQGGLTWILAALFAGAGGILLAPIVPLDPTTFTLLIVPALAAALVGSFSSFGWTVAAGILIGMGEGMIVHLQSDASWVPTGAEVLLPLLVIVIVLVARGNALPQRGALLQGRLPAAPSPRRVLPTTVVFFAIGLAAMFLLTGSYRFALIISLISAVIALSLVVVIGFAGQISLAQMALAGTAAFMLSRLSAHWGIPFPWAPLLAALFAMVIGVLVALPALRVRGTELAVITLAAALAINAVYFNNAKLTGAGVVSAATVPSAHIFGLNLSISGSDFPRPAFGIFVLVIVTVIALVVANLRRSTLGRQMLAVRADEVAASAAGINVAATKLIAFAIAAFIAGLGGSLIGYARGELSPASFAPTLSLLVLAFAYLGGISSVSGAFLAGLLGSGGLIFVSLDNWFSLGKYQTLIGGLGLIITAITNPEGMSGAFRATGAKLMALVRPAAPPGSGRERPIVEPVERSAA
jgi:branched-subunit amino acid ABC-type transport system permease component